MSERTALQSSLKFTCRFWPQQTAASVVFLSYNCRWLNMQRGFLVQKDTGEKEPEKKNDGEKIDDSKGKLVVEGRTGEIIGEVPVEMKNVVVCNATSADLSVTRVHDTESDFNLKIVNGRLHIYK